MTDRFPVVIVGGGPVGMGLAVELGGREVECLVVERHEDPQPIPKGQNLTPADDGALCTLGDRPGDS